MGKRKKPYDQEPPSDRGDDVSRRYLKGKVKPEELYDEYVNAGLSPEEAAELADLVEGQREG